MGTCGQCKQPLAWWRRDLITGLCPECEDSPGEQVCKTIKRRLLATAAILAVVSIGMIAYCTPVLDALFFDQPFSSEAWLKGDPRARGRMVRDLLSSGVLKGKTVAEIEGILGPGDRTGCDWSGPTPIYLVDIGYRWIFEPVLYEIRVVCPMGKFFDFTTEFLLFPDSAAPRSFLWTRRPSRQLIFAA